MRKIILTGGGTAGHVTPNIALIDKLSEEAFHIEYIGSKDGIEKELIEKTQVKYYGISSGKLRRYLSFKNFTDIFRILKGILESVHLINKIKPDVVFSKGGFVSVPVVLASKFHKVPVVIHESDISCGLANKISTRYANHICCTFPETLNELPKGKCHLTGSPIRKELFTGDKAVGRKLTGFSDNKPVILVMGGSLGAKAINDCLRESLDEILSKFNIIHLCGKGKKDDSIKNKGYIQFEYVSENLNDLLALSDIVVSRAGSNSISEFLALRKPNLLIPLSKKASRGDQILNAESFEKQGFSKVLYEEDLTKESLIKNINELFENKDDFINKMEKSELNNGVNEVYSVIKQTLKIK